MKRKRGKKPNPQADLHQVVQSENNGLKDLSLARPSKLMKKFEDKLRGGKFRLINQKIYYSTGESSLAMFQEDKSLFHDYHNGYQESMKQWTIQPVDLAIRWLKKQQPGLKVTDYGCGEAKIMKTCTSHCVYSLDFLPLHPDVIACDMSKSPVETASQDVAIFSLALMGTNYYESLLDATRTLKLGGILWIAEVCSRFADSQGKEEYESFFDCLEKLGFEKTLAKKPSKLFAVFIFKKAKEVNPQKKVHWPILKPCVYKKR